MQNSSTSTSTNEERSHERCELAARVCVVCAGPLIEIRQKLVCARCHTICETCCEGGRG